MRLGVAAAEQFDRGLAAAGEDGLNRRRELIAQASQRRGDVGGEGGGLIVVEHRIVGMRHVTGGLGLFLLEGEDTFEGGGERGEVVILAGRDPRLLAENHGAGSSSTSFCGNLQRL